MTDSLPPEALDFCWGSFFASNNPDFVKVVFNVATLPSDPKKINMSSEAAKWSLLGLVEKLPQVKKAMNVVLQDATKEQKEAWTKTISGE